MKIRAAQGFCNGRFSVSKYLVCVYPNAKGSAVQQTETVKLFDVGC